MGRFKCISHTHTHIASWLSSQTLKSSFVNKRELPGLHTKVKLDKTKMFLHDCYYLEKVDFKMNVNHELWEDICFLVDCANCESRQPINLA